MQRHAQSLCISVISTRYYLLHPQPGLCQPREVLRLAATEAHPQKFGVALVLQQINKIVGKAWAHSITINIQILQGLITCNANTYKLLHTAIDPEIGTFEHIRKCLTARTNLVEAQ